MLLTLPINPVFGTGDGADRVEPQKVGKVEVNAYTKYKYKKKYRYKRVYRKGRYRYVKAVYYVRYKVTYKGKGGKGTGDCWTNSEILYNTLKKKGYRVRIIQYPTSYSSRHRSVQIYSGGRWKNYDYNGNGYAWRYYATSNSKNGKVIKSC